jgi:hypothetical protein
MSRYRILSFDGGGIRGLLTATLLERLEAARPGFLAKADLYAGLPPSTIVDLYESKAGVVFADSVLDDIRDLGRLSGAEYSNANPIFDIILDATTGVADYQVARLLGERYHRLNPILPGPIELDDISQVPLLNQIGEQTDLTSTLECLDRQYMVDAADASRNRFA